MSSKQARCKHCGHWIHYCAHDASFFHDERAWGSSAVFAKDYNNYYYCGPDRKTAASPVPEPSKFWSV